MASFQASGKLYDGNGIEPDYVFQNEVDDLKKSQDKVLQNALDLLENSSK